MDYLSEPTRAHYLGQASQARPYELLMGPVSAAVCRKPCLIQSQYFVKYASDSPAAEVFVELAQTVATAVKDLKS